MGPIEILWTVTGVVVPLLLGTAWAMVGLTPPEFWVAREAIGLAAFIFGATALIWLSASEWPNTARALIGVVLGAAALVGFSEAIRWVNMREGLVISQAAVAIDKRAEKRAQLQKFYIEAGNLSGAVLPKDISPEDFKKYDDEVIGWLNKTAAWIGENLGEAAKAKFLDRSGALSFSYSGAVNKRHEDLINGLASFRKNLSTLIETNAWDKS